MNNILVTGSKGFIGKNLLKRIDKNIFKILEFNRSDSLEKLEELIKKSDFIIHLAGEVRPNSSENDFKTSNISLTKDIINIIENNNLKLPIILSSSIHAKLLKNEYGKTKRESELIVENYSNKNNTNSIILRLPHVFGEGCKPNYNSVISTWIYNSINDLEIKVFDRDIQMTYVYVQDIVTEIIDFLLNRIKSDELYYEPRITFNTTLGEVVDFIEEFKRNINDVNYKINELGFKQKLFKTYKDYYRSINV